jgi:hypothetical protein
MVDYKNEALEHELKTTMTLLQDSWEMIERANDDFFADPDLDNGFKFTKALRSWIDNRKKYEMLHKIYHHGWSEDGTRFE